MNRGPVRVLHIVGAMNRGGAESMLMSLYRGLDRTRIQFDFLEFTESVSDFSSEIEELGGRVIKCGWSQSPANLVWTHRRIVKLIKDAGPYAAAHSHVLFATGTVLAAAKTAGIPVRIAHSHNTSDTGDGLILRSYRAVARILIHRNSTSRVACSVEAGRFLFGSSFLEDGGVVVPNSVDLDRFRPAISAGGRDVLASSPMRISLAAVGRLEPVKNHQFLIDLAATLRARDFDFVLTFVGSGSLRTTLEARISEMGLEDRIALLGMREDVDAILRESDALLMPSLWEGLPVTLVEAQATGLPCMVSDTITREADLGLGLLTFLSLESVSVWADSIEAGFPSRPAPEEIRKTLEARGYTVAASLEKILPLYSISLQPGGLN